MVHGNKNIDAKGLELSQIFFFFHAANRDPPQ